MNRLTLAHASAAVKPCRSHRSPTTYCARFSFLISRRSTPCAAKPASGSSEWLADGVVAGGGLTGGTAADPPARISHKGDDVRHLAREGIGVGRVGFFFALLHRTSVFETARRSRIPDDRLNVN